MPGLAGVKDKFMQALKKIPAKIAAVFQDRRKAYELLVGLALLLLMSVVAFGRALEPFELLSLDWRFRLRGARPFPASIALVGIDEASLHVVPQWPWPRDIYANLMRFLDHKDFRPAVIGYDILLEYQDPGAPGSDGALTYYAESLQKHLVMPFFFERGYPSLVRPEPEKEKRLEAFALPESRFMPKALDIFDGASLPFTELSEVSDLGFVNVPIDSDGITRRVQLLARYDGKVYASMSLMVVLRYLGLGPEALQFEKNKVIIQKSPDEQWTIPVNERGEMLINYYGATNHIEIAQYPFLEVIRDGSDWMGGRRDLKVLPNLKDRVVLIGATALGLEDRRVTPMRALETGVSVQAQAVANIIERNFLKRTPLFVSWLLLAIVGLVAGMMTMFLKITHSLPAIIGLCAGYFAVTQLCFLGGVWVDLAVHETTVILLFIGITSFRYFTTLEELRRTHLQLIQSSKMAAMGTLSAGIAHEFRNILNAIGLHVEYCSMPGASPERVMKYMEKVKAIMGNANMILNGLLTFARKSESVKKPGNLKKTVENTLLLLEKEIMRHQIQVDKQLDEISEIEYDEGQISQVIMNLINNARDAMKEQTGKKLTLVLKEEVKTVRLDIGDNGPGIPPQILKRIFEPFVTSKPSGQGTGLGLSVCHGIVRNHGGDIKVTTAKGKGTVWHIFLPK